MEQKETNDGKIFLSSLCLFVGNIWRFIESIRATHSLAVLKSAATTTIRRRSLEISTWLRMYFHS